MESPHFKNLLKFRSLSEFSEIFNTISLMYECYIEHVILLANIVEILFLQFGGSVSPFPIYTLKIKAIKLKSII